MSFETEQVGKAYVTVPISNKVSAVSNYDAESMQWEMFVSARADTVEEAKEKIRDFAKRLMELAKE